MSKFKIGDIVNVLYDFDKIVKGKVIDFNQTTLGTVKRRKFLARKQLMVAIEKSMN